jgi:hypothetical protein
VRASDRVIFASFSPLFLSCGQKRVLNGGVSRIFASRRSGGRRSVHGMVDVLTRIYSSFSVNCCGRRRPWSRECQLFFHVSAYFGETTTVCTHQRERRYKSDTQKASAREQGRISSKRSHPRLRRPNRVIQCTYRKRR